MVRIFSREFGSDWSKSLRSVSIPPCRTKLSWPRGKFRINVESAKTRRFFVLESVSMFSKRNNDGIKPNSKPFDWTWGFLKQKRK